jgi:hypothetical protein
MKDFYFDHKEFISACSAIFIGIGLGFTATRLINEKLSNHAFYNCSTGQLVFINDAIIGGKFACLKK